MSESAPGSADLAPPERLHPLILLTGLGGSLRGVAGGYAGLGYLAATGKLTVALLGAAVLLVVVIGGLFLYWRRFEYRVGANEIRIDSGILSRTHRSIPFDRIQDVDISQGPLARLLGIAKVKLETGGSAAPGQEEGVLSAIALSRAEALREHVRARRGLVIAPANDGSDDEPLFAMDPRRVLTAGIFNFSLAIFAGLLGATQTLGDVIGFDPFRRAFWERLLTGNPLANYAASHRVSVAIAGLLLLALVGLLTGLVRTTLRDWGFRIDRTGTGMRRRRGLLTRTDVTLPVRRVQAALVLTGPVRERFGWRELKLQSLAADEGKERDHVVAPLATSAELRPLFEALGWAPPAPYADWRPVERAYVSIFLLAWSPLLLFALLQALVGAGLLVRVAASPPAALSAAAPLLVASGSIGAAALLSVVTRFLSWRHTAYAIEADRLLVRTGWWRRRLTILPFASVQSVDISEHALGRRFGIVALVIGVAGGSASGHRIPAIARKKASQIRTVLLSRFS